MSSWAAIEPHLPELPRREDGRGRPWRASREVIDGILWVLRSGTRWQDQPGRFPPYQTCHKRFQQWVKDGTLGRIATRLDYAENYLGFVHLGCIRILLRRYL